MAVQDEDIYALVRAAQEPASAPARRRPYRVVRRESTSETPAQLLNQGYRQEADGTWAKVVGTEPLPDDDLYAPVRAATPSQEAAQTRAMEIVGTDATDDRENALYQGVTLGFADEVGGNLAGWGQQLRNIGRTLSGQPIEIRGADLRDAVIEQTRDRNAAFRETNPGQSLGFELAGGALTGGGAIGSGVRGAALTGAAYGGGYGFGSAEGGFAERLPGAGSGVVVGAVGGAAVQRGAQLASPYARRLGSIAGGFADRVRSGVSEAGARVSRGFGRQPEEAVVTPQATQAAGQYVQRLVDSSGRSLADNPLTAMGKPITAAEAIGPSGVAQVTALTRRSGRAAGLVQDQLGDRARNAPGRVIQDFADLTGADPEGAADVVSNLAAQGRRKAAPLYEAAYAAQIQTTPVLDDILRRPTGQAALRRAYRLAQDEGRNPEDLGLFVMERPRGSGASSPRPVSDADLTADLDALRAGRRTVGGGRGKSLLQFISENGGVQDYGDELSTMGADVWNRQGSWRRRVVTENGTDLETMARRAYDAGYFPEIVDATADSAENYQRVSTNDLLDAIAEELRGNARFAREAGDTDSSAAAMMRKARREALDERLNREGIDIANVDNATVARLLREADDAEARAMAFLNDDAPGEPQVDFVPGATPSMQTLDYVKRGMDDVLNGYRDSTTQRLNLDSAGRAVLDNVTTFRDELVRINPAYGEALRAGGDPIRLEGAFREAKRLFFTANERVFSQRVASMGEAERGGLIAGLADELYNRAQNGRLRPRDLRVPAFRNKLATLVGPGRADDFVARIEAEISLSRTGGRMAPGTNSTTGEVQEAIRMQDQEVGFGADLARNIEQSGPLGGTVRTGLQAVSAPVAGFVRGFQAPAPVPVRDEIARLLMMAPDVLGDELADIVAQAQAARAANRPPPRAVRAYLTRAQAQLGAQSPAAVRLEQLLLPTRVAAEEEQR